MTLTLLCPVCKSPLSSVDTREITIDKCPFCNGIWFDSGELRTYCAGRDRSGSSKPFAGAAFEIHKKLSRRDCPRCETDSLRLGTLSGYDVWKCDDCRGYFVFSETISEFIPITAAEVAVVGLEGLLALLTAGL